MAMTPAERQRRRRARLAAVRDAEEQAQAPTITLPLAERLTRQEAWDEACETIQVMLETYRVWRATTPAPLAAEPRLLDLHRLAGVALSLAVLSFPDAFGAEWHFPDEPTPSKDGTGLDRRSLREQLFAADPPSLDPDNFPRTAEDDVRALDWWNRLPPDARSTWQNAVRAEDPRDVWYVVRGRLGAIR
jgi:hypothetical protein